MSRVPSLGPCQCHGHPAGDAPRVAALCGVALRYDVFYFTETLLKLSLRRSVSWPASPFSFACFAPGIDVVPLPCCQPFRISLRPYAAPRR